MRYLLLSSVFGVGAEQRRVHIDCILARGRFLGTMLVLQFGNKHLALPLDLLSLLHRFLRNGSGLGWCGRGH